MSATAASPWVGTMLPVHDVGAGVHAPVALAREADRLGLDSVWIGDHLSFREPILEAVVTASFVAEATQRVTIGFGVLQLAMRHPVWLAKQLATLSVLASGRVEIGVGIGGENPDEWEAAGVPVEERVARTEELLGLLPRLLSGQPVAHRGTHYEFSSPPLLPAPAAVPVLWMGGRSDAALKRAAEHAHGWLGLWADEGRVRESADKLEALASRAARPAPSIALVIPVVVDDDVGRAAAQLERFVFSQYGLAYERVARWCIGGDEGAIAERLGSYVQAGVSGFVLMSAAADPLAELGRLANVRELIRAS